MCSYAGCGNFKQELTRKAMSCIYSWTFATKPYLRSVLPTSMATLALGYYFKKRRSYKLQKVHFKFKNWVTTKILLFSSNFNINISFLVAILKLLSNSHSCFRFLNYTWKFYDGVIWFFLMDYWFAFVVIKLWGSEITFWFWFF